jgi:subtilisin family serine protease
LPIFAIAAVASFGARAQVGQIGYGGSNDIAFNQKADKLLKHIYYISRQATTLSGARPEKTAQEIDRLSRFATIRRGEEGSVTIGVLVKLKTSDAAQLETAGFGVGATIGDMSTVETTVERLPELASFDSVERIWAATYRRPLNDRARQTAGIDDSSGQRVLSQRGAGVVVGILDSGIDFRHLDFTVPGSNGTQTRIKYLLDMTAVNDDTSSWNYTLPGGSAPIGRLYTQTDLNAALAVPKPSQTSDTVKQRDKNGHGTHVAGIAAGNGLAASASPGVYAGMAPEADLIVVKASREDDGSASFGLDDEVNGLQFIQTKAAELGEPFVINMSLGGQAGPHDGTDPDEMAIDNLVGSGTGRAVCVAAGNEGDANIHAATTVPAGGTVTLHFNATTNPSFIDLYSSPRGTNSSGRYTVTVTEPGGTQLGPLAFSATGFDQSNGQLSDSSVRLWNALDTKGTVDTSDDQADIFLLFKTGAKTGTWTIRLDNGGGEPASNFDAWSDGDDVSFADFVDNTSHLISSPGTSRGAITVGAYVARSAVQTIGDYAPFTSPGPTADGRQKPETSADGYYLYSSRSSDIIDPSIFTYGSGSNALAAGVSQSLYGGLAGTSMATPGMTGSVALLLQTNQTLSAANIKTLIENSATRDSFVQAAGVDAGGWNSHFGFGKLNIAAALAAGSSTTIQFSAASYSVGEGDGEAQITVIRTGDTSGPSTVDYRTTDTDTFTVSCADTVNNHGSAYARCDFATVVGTLSFAAGETTKAFGVPIIDDALAEGNETFNVVLSNPTGAALGSPSMATVTIIDNDAVNGPNPILQTNGAGVAFFVRQHYLDFLGREPEPGEPWSVILSGCADQLNVDPNSPSASCDRITVSGAFFGSPEFKDKGVFVIDFYRVAFGRLPQYSEFVTDLASLVGATAQDVSARRAAFANNFVQRPEFATIAAMSNSNYVTTLTTGSTGQNYNLTSITTPDPANPDGTNKVTLTTNDLINGLNGGALTKAQVLRAIVQSDQIVNIEAVSTFVASQYYGYLRRTPDTAGFNNWVNYLTTHPADFRTMVNGFLNSQEYRLRFGAQ